MEVRTGTEKYDRYWHRMLITLEKVFLVYFVSKRIVVDTKNKSLGENRYQNNRIAENMEFHISKHECWVGFGALKVKKYYRGDMGYVISGDDVVCHVSNPQYITWRFLNLWRVVQTWVTAPHVTRHIRRWRRKSRVKSTMQHISFSCLLTYTLDVRESPMFHVISRITSTTVPRDIYSILDACAVQTNKPNKS